MSEPTIEQAAGVGLVPQEWSSGGNRCMKATNGRTGRCHNRARLHLSRAGLLRVQGVQPARAADGRCGRAARTGADTVTARREWSAFLRRAGRWEQIGTTGTREHVADELADWRRDEPHGEYGVGYRIIGEWFVDEVRS